MNEERIVTAGVRTDPAMTEKRTPEMIGAEIRMYTDAGRRLTLLCGIEIGRRLVEAKEMLQHGEWLGWLERETEFSSSSAQRYMTLFNEYGASQLGLFGPETNCPTLGNMSISKALRLLALPEGERESFAEEYDVEHLTAREVERLVKQRTAELEAEKETILREAQEDKAEMQKLQNAVDILAKDRDELDEMRAKAEEKLELSEQERAKAEADLLRIRKELREIESRPQPVAYERDEQAIRDAADAARKEAEKAAKDKISTLNKEIKAAKEQQAEAAKQLEELKAKAAEAQKAGAEAPQLRAQIKALEGKLAVASPEVAEFKAAFDRAQNELVTMLKALRKVQDPEIKAKLSTAAKTVLGNFAGQIEG